MAELVRIWSNQQGRWWAPNEAGYTRIYEWAGLYPIDRARAIVERCNAYDTTQAHDNTGRRPDTQVPNEVIVRVVTELEPLAGDGTGAALPEIDGTSEVIDPGLLAAERERIALAIEAAYAAAIETAAGIARTGPPPSITCPRCQRTSYNPGDIANGYCGACHDFTSREG